MLTRSLDIGKVTLLGDDLRLALIRTIHWIPVEDQVYPHPQVDPDVYENNSMFKPCEGGDPRLVRFTLAG
jgi:hypothetical protein